MSATHDIAILGAGFAGSLFALICRRLGRSVVLIEKDSHPRFAIGESSTPLANLLLEELSTQYDLPRIGPLTKWGTWQRSYPQIACGLKRGFTFYHHEFGQPFRSLSHRGNELLVAASPRDEIADTHWYRADFDQFLAEEAKAAGVDYYDRVTLEKISFEAAGAALEGEREKRRFAVQARLVVDATGPHGFLHRALGLREAGFPDFPSTEALYCHFTGVQRPGDFGADANGERPPYRVGDAAIHHIFSGGWIWILHFNNGVTSAGVAATAALARELNLSDPKCGWSNLLDRLPTVREQFRHAEPRFVFRHAPRLAFRSSQVAGPRWALLPSAAGFVDPLLSTGFPLTLLGIGRLAGMIARDFDSPRFPDALARYAASTTAELLATAQLVAALYAQMHDFPVFAAIARLYFAAASFSETARRLGHPERSGSFLMHDHAEFGPAFRALTQRALRPLAGSARRELLADLERAIAPIDIAGLGDHRRRNWHPVQADDLLDGAPKLAATRPNIAAMLKRCRFFN